MKQLFLLLMILLIPASTNVMSQEMFAKIKWIEGCVAARLQVKVSVLDGSCKVRGEKDYIFDYEQHYALAVCKMMYEELENEHPTDR